VIEVPNNLVEDNELKEMLKQLKDEINTLRTVKHENIVRLYDVK